MPNSSHRSLRVADGLHSVEKQHPRSERSTAKVSFPITISVVDPVLPLDAKSLLDILKVCARLKN
jgi:hypothetical protein